VKGIGAAEYLDDQRLWTGGSVGASRVEIQRGARTQNRHSLCEFFRFGLLNEVCASLPRCDDSTSTTGIIVLKSTRGG
jgi:hypothetical protein